MVFRGKNLFDDLAHSNWVGLRDIVESLDSFKHNGIGLSIKDLEEFLACGQYVAMGFGEVEDMQYAEEAAHKVAREILGFVDGKSIKTMMVRITGPNDMPMSQMSELVDILKKQLGEDCSFIWEFEVNGGSNVRVVAYAIWEKTKGRDIIPVPCGRNLMSDVTHNNWIMLRELVDDLTITTDEDVGFDLNDYKTFLKFGQHIAIGVGMAEDGEYTQEAANRAKADIQCFLGERLVNDIAVHISMGPEASMVQLVKVNDGIQELASEDANFIWGLRQHSSNDNHVHLVVQVLW